MKRKEREALPRREFLKTAGLVGGAAGVAATALSSEEAAAKQPTGDDARGTSYRETEHVKTYYDLARF